MITFSQLGKKGRLANQLFQIAATIGFAKYNKQDWVLPKWEYQPYFKNKLPVGHIDDCKIFAEDMNKFEIELDATSNWDLDGHFMAEDYFGDKDQIRHIFEPSNELAAYIEEKYADLLQQNTCSIHVRRGDYLKVQGYHPIPGVRYFKNAMNKFPDATFVIFSDDIDWCKANLPTDAKTVFVEGEKDIVDLFLMSHCKNNIITNSTFSWWAAWLNKNPAKRVIMPDRWFGYQVGAKPRNFAWGIYRTEGFEEVASENVLMRCFRSFTDPIRYFNFKDKPKFKRRRRQFKAFLKGKKYVEN